MPCEQSQEFSVPSLARAKESRPVWRNIWSNPIFATKSGIHFLAKDGAYEGKAVCAGFVSSKLVDSRAEEPLAHPKIFS